MYARTRRERGWASAAILEGGKFFAILYGRLLRTSHFYIKALVCSLNTVKNVCTIHIRKLAVLWKRCGFRGASAHVGGLVVGSLLDQMTIFEVEFELSETMPRLGWINVSSPLNILSFEINFLPFFEFWYKIQPYDQNKDNYMIHGMYQILFVSNSTGVSLYAFSWRKMSTKHLLLLFGSFGIFIFPRQNVLFKVVESNLLHLLEKVFNRKLTSAKPYPNSNPNHKAQ